MRGTCRDIHFPYLILSPPPDCKHFVRKNPKKSGNSENFISSGENAFFKGLMEYLLPRSRGSGSMLEKR